MSRRDELLKAEDEARRRALVRPEPQGISFAAGPISADTARILFQRLSEACAALPRDETLFAHVHQGEQHRDGVVVTFYPVVTFARRIEARRPHA